MLEKPPPTLQEIIAAKREAAKYRRERRRSGKENWRRRKTELAEKREQEMKGHGTSPHKYKIVKRESGKRIFRCMIPSCSHFVTRELAIGAYTICWGCNKSMIMTNASVYKRVKPLCAGCISKNKKRGLNIGEALKEDSSIQDVLEKFGVVK